MVTNRPGFSEDNRRLDLARTGDRDAQERLLEPMRPRLKAFFARRVRDIDEAENLAQQTLLQACQRLGEFRGECPFDRWVWCIAGNLAVQHYRSTSKVEVSAGDFEDCDLPQAPSGEPDVLLAQWLHEVLDAAKDACSQTELTVMLTFYQVGSFDKVAEILELNARTVRSHFYRGRGILLAHLIHFLPEVVGGRDLIMLSARKLLNNPDGEGLDSSEFEALSLGRYPSKTYRSACLKVARLLPNPFQVR